MNFTFVNKNLLIPQVETYSDFDSPIQKLLNMGYNMSNLYCSNLYVVSTNCIYFLKNNYLYSVSETNIILCAKFFVKFFFSRKYKLPR